MRLIAKENLLRASRVMGVLSLTLVLGACARDVTVPPYAVDGDVVWVLTPPLSSPKADRMAAILRDVLPEADHVPFAMWDAALEEALNRRGVVTIPDARQWPVSFRPVLQDYLERGGKALFLGREPFSYPAVLAADGAVRSREEHHAHLADVASDYTGFSAVQLWSHQSSDPARRSRVRVAHDPRMPRPGVEVEVEYLDESNYMCLPEMPDDFSESGYNTLTLYARGSPETTRLVVRAETEVGALWVRDIPVDEDWQRVVIGEADWVRVEPDTGRVVARDDRFRLIDVVRLCVGLDARVAPQRPGAHVYGVSDIRPAKDAHATGKPDASANPFVADKDARFSFTAQAVEGVRSEALFHIGRRTVDALRPHPSARYPDESTRWVSLFTARDRSGEASGDVAGLFVRLPSESAPQFWGWIGVDPERSTRRALSTMINECLFHLQRGRFLVGTHATQAVFEPPHLFMVQTRMVSVNPAPVSARVTAELVDRNGHIVRRIVSAPLVLDPATETPPPLMMNVGVVPRAEERAADYELHVGLEEVGGRRLVFDQSVHPVKVLGERVTPFHTEILGVSGARIAMGRVSVFFLGVDYSPGMDRGADGDWLLPHVFPAMQVRRDLERLRNAGVNTVSLPYTDPAQASSLRYVMEEAQARGMWVQIRFPSLLRRLFEEDWLEEMVTALRLPGDAKVFSLDIAPGSSFRDADAQPLLARAWNEWLLEQYGDIEHAAGVHGEWLEIVPADGTARYPTWNRLAPLPDDAVAWRVMRRFAADFQSRRMGRAVRELRRLDCGQLVTARVSVRDTDLRVRAADPLFPFDIGTGRVHLDFATLGAEHIRGHEPDLGASAFMAAYARGWMDGGPVVWADMGIPLGGAPRDADFEHQAHMVEEMLGLVFGSHAAGAIFRHYAPVSENKLDADEGLAHPDGSARPALRVVRSEAGRLRAYRVAPMQWAGREADPGDGARGLYSLRDNWRRVYREELEAQRVEAIRPMGYGRSSLETPMERLDGGTNGPLTKMNAEWGRIEVGGRRVTPVPGEPIRVPQGRVMRVELINSGVSRWAASRDRARGTVWVEVDHAERRSQYLEVDDTAPGRRYRLEWRPADLGMCVLRPYWLGAGGFGEALVVEVVPAL